jgi:hypothetical protein
MILNCSILRDGILCFVYKSRLPLRKAAKRYRNSITHKKIKLSPLNLFTMMLFVTTAGKAQSINEIFANSGIWTDYGMPVSKQAYPEVKGRLVNIYWSDIEKSPNVWDWSAFDSDIASHTQDNLPVVFMVYTRMAAPNWIFNNGVPKVTETDNSGNYIGYSPYYLNNNYNVYFKRMITTVRKHVELLKPSLRNNIIGVQACFGSTGDPIEYKGKVAKQYEITTTQFDSLFKVYSLCYYNEYKPLVPVIKILSHAKLYDSQQVKWLDSNCPGGWIKCPNINKGYQLNMELDKYQWLYDMMNKPCHGEYMKSRSEIIGAQLNAGWWTKSPYKNMFQVVCYGIFWGLDWPNETTDIIKNPKYDSAFHFFNKYAGQKVAPLATNALCVLKDALDASDGVRFPASVYGTVDRYNTTRYENIYKKYISYGAKLEDKSVITGNDYDCLEAKGTNDVGWRLLPGNYERYLHQIDANITSAGYWNLDSENSEAMYGRFARGFDLLNNKDGLYFDVEDGFLRNAPLNGSSPVTIEITYYDKGNGQWHFLYDAKANQNQELFTVKCTNTKTWKKKIVTLKDAYFGNRGLRGSDFYIKNSGSENVFFSIIELSRAGQSANGIVTTPLASFDTVCVKGTANPESFVITAAYLNGKDVQVGPFRGYSFSKSQSGSYTASLVYSNYGTQINSTVFVKINTDFEGAFAGNIPVTGGGASPASVRAKGTVLNTSPILTALVTPVSCNKMEDGAINLLPAGGVRPFSYQWTSTLKAVWKDTAEDVHNLKEADYTVTVNSFAGCATTKTFGIVDPGVVPKPAGLQGPNIVNKLAQISFSIKDPASPFSYVWTVPSDATITSGQNTSVITVKWGKGSGTVAAKSKSECGISQPATKVVSVNLASFDAATMETANMPNVASSHISLTNPASDFAILQFHAKSSSAYIVQVTDLSGRILLFKKGMTMAGQNIERLNIRQFAAGNYFVSLINTERPKQTLQLVKQ